MLEMRSPFYETGHGAAYLGDALDLLKDIPDDSVHLVLTSPPYALTFQKAYGNVSASEYVEWFLPFAEEIKRVLRGDGSFVLDIGAAWNKGQPTQSLYHYRLLIALCDILGFSLAQEFFWYNPAAIPAPAEWVNVRRIRVKAAVDHIWWLSKTPFPKANNENVLREYSTDMLRLIKRGYRAKQRPSGHNITAKWAVDRGGAIPPNLLEMGNNDSNGSYLKACKKAGLPAHPARFPSTLPKFFIKFCTDPTDIVLDPFAGSNTTGEVAEALGRRWLAFEIDAQYLEGSRFRFIQPALELAGTLTDTGAMTPVQDLR